MFLRPLLFISLLSLVLTAYGTDAMVHPLSHIWSAHQDSHSSAGLNIDCGHCQTLHQAVFPLAQQLTVPLLHSPAVPPLLSQPMQVSLATPAPRIRAPPLS